jgi:ABC-type nitrate/sulfonate/bicarbonate transport system substrate-binding protein
MKQIWLIRLTGFILILGLIGVSPTILSKGKDKIKLFTIKSQTQVGFVEYFVAEDLGYFKEEGIRLEYVGVLQAGTEIATVVSGNVDVFTGHPNTVVRAILAGAKIKIVAPGMVDNPTYPHMIYFVKKGSAVGSAKDIRQLKRKVKVAVSAINSCTDLLFYEWLTQNGLKESKAEFVIMPDKQQEQALEQGLVDVATLHPAYWKQAIENKKLAKLVSTWEITKSPGAGASIRGFSEKFLQEHPNEVRGFVRALIKAHKWINTHLQEAIEINARHLGLKPEDVTAFWYDENDYIQDSYINEWFKMMLKHGQLKKGQIKPADVYTNDYNPYYKKPK